MTNALLKHLARCLIAGVIAVLPIGGTILGLVLAEKTIAESWRDEVAWYFPGLGLIAAAVLLYLLGLVVSTFLGRWIWGRVDALLGSLPALGRLYGTLKQILGYGEGEDALFRGVVLVPSPFGGAREIGLVTGTAPDGRIGVFLPGSPNPATGRLLLVERDRVTPVDVTVNDALKTLLSVGATPLG
jgi:uncharacterized membrane protein